MHQNWPSVPTWKTKPAFHLYKTLLVCHTDLQSKLIDSELFLVGFFFLPFFFLSVVLGCKVRSSNFQLYTQSKLEGQLSDRNPHPIHSTITPNLFFYAVTHFLPLIAVVLYLECLSNLDRNPTKITLKMRFDESRGRCLAPQRRHRPKDECIHWFTKKALRMHVWRLLRRACLTCRSGCT